MKITDKQIIDNAKNRIALIEEEICNLKKQMFTSPYDFVESMKNIEAIASTSKNEINDQLRTQDLQQYL